MILTDVFTCGKHHYSMFYPADPVPKTQSTGDLILKVEDVWLSFGGVAALIGVSLELHRGEILGLIGPNGAGKTALLNCITGFYKPQRGVIFFNGRKISGLNPDKLARFGIGRTFQNIGLVAGLTVLQNLLAARHIFMRQNLLTGALYIGWAKREEAQHREVVEEIVDFLDLQPWRNELVASLPYGLRKRVELGRVLAMEPQVLLLDEPMAGMNYEEKEEFVRYILEVFQGQRGYRASRVLQEGVQGIIFVEHDMGVVMRLAHRLVVLDFGKKIAEGPPEEVRRNPEVIRAYLGEG